MVSFGVDLSSDNDGVSIADVKAAGFRWVTARAVSYPQGVMVADPKYGAWRDEAKALGFPFAAYQMVHTYYSAREQVQHLADVIGDESIPVMIDIEPDSGSPTMTHLTAFYDACKVENLRPVSLYLPHWYWSTLNGPSLTVRAWALISSSFGTDQVGTAADRYRAQLGDLGVGWNAYGGLSPVLWQFGSQIRCGAHLVDADASKHTVADLVRSGLFTDWGVTPMSGPVGLDPADTTVAKILAALSYDETHPLVDNLGTIAKSVHDLRSDTTHPPVLVTLDRKLDQVLAAAEQIETMGPKLDALAAAIAALQAAAGSPASYTGTIDLHPGT